MTHILNPYADQLDPELMASRRSYSKAQTLLSGVATKSLGVRPVTWAGSSVLERGSVAVVREDDPELLDLVGEVIRVAPLVTGGNPPETFVYVTGARPLVDVDVLVSRRPFSAIAPLSTEVLDATVEIVGEVEPPVSEEFIPTVLEGIEGWWRASSPIAGAVNNTTQSRWPDISGRHRDLIQNTTADRPTYLANIANGLPVFRFDGSTDGMNFTDALNWINTNQLSYFVVFIRRGAQADGRFVSLSADGFSDFDVATGTSLTYNAASTRVEGWRSNSKMTHQVDPGVGVIQLHSMVFSPPAVPRHRYNRANATDSTGNVINTALAVQQLWVGKRGGATPSPMQFDLAELIIYNRGLPDSERSRVEDYLAGTYGL